MQAKVSVLNPGDTLYKEEKEDAAWLNKYLSDTTGESYRQKS